MREFERHPIIRPLVGAIAFFMSSSAFAGTGHDDIRPEWVRDSEERPEVRPNLSYLKKFKTLEESLEEPTFPILPEEYVDSRKRDRLKIEYRELERERDQYIPHGGMTPEEGNAYNTKVTKFSETFLRTVLDFQIQQSLKKAEKHSDEVRTFRLVEHAITKSNVKFSPHPEFKFGVRPNLPELKGQLWMKSPIVDGRFDVNFGESYTRQSEVVSRKLYSQEKYQVSLTRDLVIWDLQSALIYGGSTTDLTAALIKRFGKQWRWELASTRGMNPRKSTVPVTGEEKLQMIYKIGF